MSLNDFSNVVVSAEGPALTQVGFGTIGLGGYHTYWADYSRTYTDSTGMASDGFPTDHPLYVQAAEVFAQSPRVANLKILRFATPIVQTVRLTPLAVNSASYDFTIHVRGRDPVDVSIDADLSATVDEICDAIQTALDAAFKGVIQGTSTSSVAVATGAKTFTTQAGLYLPVGSPIVATSVAGADTMTGVVASYSGTTLTITVASVTGSGTDTDWTFTVDYLVTTPDAGTATHLDLTIPSTVIGKTFSVSGWRPDRIKVEDRTPDPGVAADLNAIRAVDADWYGLATACNSEAFAEAVADWAEGQLVVYATNTGDWEALDQTSTLDLQSKLEAKSYVRTKVHYHAADLGEFMGAAALGERFPFDPGTPPSAGGTFNAKTLKAITVDSITPAQKTVLLDKGYTIYETTAGRNHTLGSRAAGGVPFDQTRFVDWFVTRLQESLAAVQLNNGRVPYDERGLAVLQAACQSMIQQGLISGGISPTDADGNPPTVVMPTIAQCSDADRSARVLGGPGIKISFKYAGAIEKANVGITVLL
jgi:hypothetical protein